MANKEISQLPIALFVTPSSDYLEISQATGNPPYTSKRALVSTLWPPASQLPGISPAGASIITATDAAAQVALLPAFIGDHGSGGYKGLVPAPAAGDAALLKFLKADGTWATIGPGGQVQSDWNAVNGIASILNKPTSMTPTAHAATHASAGSDPVSIAATHVTGLATVATSGSYNNLSNTPTIPPPLSTTAIDTYDDFSGPPGVTLAGRHPITGSYTWSATGPGSAGAYAGSGILGTTIASNTYYVLETTNTPWQVCAKFMNPVGTPQAVIAIIKQFDTHGATVMWHTEFSNSINMSYWNAAWNGGSDVTSVQPTDIVQDSSVTLTANTWYYARVTINPPYANACIEDLNGNVLISVQAYEPLMSNLVGNWFFVQSPGGHEQYGSVEVWGIPNYPITNNGIDNVVIGSRSPLQGNFSALTVGNPNTQKGLFSVYCSQVTDAPIFWGPYGGSVALKATTVGYGCAISLGNALGYSSGIDMDGAGTINIRGGNGYTAFLTKPTYNIPYVQSEPLLGFAGLGFGGTDATVPMLRHSGTTLQVKLGDNTADAPLTAASFGTSSATLLSGQSSGYGTPTGGAKTANYAAYSGQTYTGSYVQATCQATDDAVKKLGQMFSQLIVDLKAGNMPAA